MKVLLFLVIAMMKLMVLELSHALTCQSPGDSTAPPYALPSSQDSYVVEVEANIIDKGYTVEATIYYSYPDNAATIQIFKQGTDMRYIFNYATDEIFTVSGTDCIVDQLSTSNNIYVKWLIGPTVNKLHIPSPHWNINFQYGKSYGEIYVKNDTMRGVPVDHWQSCGKWEPKSNMLIDYYFSSGWTSASTYPRVPVRTEIMADKQLTNGSVYSLHHIYDYFNFRAEAVDDPTIFQTPAGVVCPGRKNTKALPTLPPRFYVRSEIIYSNAIAVTYEDVWYDDIFKLYRRDYKPLSPKYPTFSVNTLTEIHDYYIGARYVIDKYQGNCTTLPLSNTSGDALQNMTAEARNGSYIINLRNPLQLFNLDWNYTYIGQVQERGVLCDVYVTMRNDLIVAGSLIKANTTITFYFLAPEWNDYDNRVVAQAGYATPLKMVLRADEIGLNVIYNYVDFAIKPLLEIYDISTCYPEAEKVKFQVKFQGTIQQQIMVPSVKDEANMVFAQQLGVSFLRIQEVGVVFDDAFTYISATLLDKAPATAQFEYIPGKVIEKQDDKNVTNIFTPMICAGYCINNKDFICNSFDFCSNDLTCRLSRAHIGDGKAKVVNSQTCDHFSRSVNGVHDEPSIDDAFNALKVKVYNHRLMLQSVIGQPPLVAVDVSVTFGWVTSQVSLPTIHDSIHYRLEGTSPGLQYTYEGEVWYDKTFQLMRYDNHFEGPMTNVYNTSNPLSFINDFSTGLQYVIDKVDRNCTIQAIPEGDFGAAHTPMGLDNSTWSLRMKSQYEILHMDSKYLFVGQQTVRGMLCNVFESQRSDYRVPGISADYPSIFRYFFLAKGWTEVSEEPGGATLQPVRLEIAVLQIGVFIEYSFYDFNSDRPDMSVYDIHDCFNTLNRKTFQITFPGPYYPYLATTSSKFQNDVIFALSRVSLLPPLNFQRTRIDYDRNNIYVTTTMVRNTAIADYFTHIINGSVVKHVDRVNSFSVGSAVNCAQMCYEGFPNLTCNSFYYCAKEKQCLFSGQNVPTGPKKNRVAGCEAYSRTVTSRDLPQLSNLVAFTLIKNNVYGGKFSIPIAGPGPLKPYTYTASMVRTDIVQSGPHTAQNSAMHQFTLVKSNSKTTYADGLLDALSVDDCALACTSTKDFQCRGFYYCEGIFTCGLIQTRPDQLPANGTIQTDACYISQRMYLADYISSPGTVSMTTADKTVMAVTSTDSCAKTCTQESMFQCRSFEFCQNGNSCLLFRGRTFGKPASGVPVACNQFIRNYLIDFQAVSAGTYVFTSVIQYLSVSVSQCAQLCIEQQGTSCHGFYFCEKNTACHLTSAQAGQPQVHVDTSSQAILCNYYKRLNDIHNATLHTSQPLSQSAKVTHSPSTSSTVAGSGSATHSTVAGPSSASRVTTGSIHTATQTVKQTPTSVGVSPTPQQQTGDNGNKVKSGSVVGIAFGTFILGLIVGAVVLFLVTKFRAKTHEEYEMHITKHEH